MSSRKKAIHGIRLASRMLEVWGMWENSETWPARWGKFSTKSDWPSLSDCYLFISVVLAQGCFILSYPMVNTKLQHNTLKFLYIDCIVLYFCLQNLLHIVMVLSLDPSYLVMEPGWNHIEVLGKWRIRCIQESQGINLHAMCLTTCIFITC